MQPTYTPTVNTGSVAPQFGQQDATGSTAVRDFQTAINAKNASNPNFVPLVTDGKYGPLTRAASGNSVVVTAGPATDQFNTHSTNLQGMLNNAVNPDGTPKATLGNTNDSYTQALDSLSSTSGNATKALVNTIMAQRASQGAQTDSQYQNYKNALQALGIQHNEAQFSPDLLTSHINEAENQHQQAITKLNVDSNKALMDAEQAQAKGDLDTLDKKMAYIKDLNQQKQDYLKNIADNMGYQSKINDTYAGQVYDQLNKLPAEGTAREDFLKNIAKQYASQGVSLAGLTKAVADYKNKQTTDNLDIEQKKANLTKTKAETAKLDKTADEAVLTQTVLNSLKKANPMIDSSYGTTKAEALKAVANAQAITKAVRTAAQNKALTDEDGKFTAEYVKNALDNLPTGIDRTEFLNSIKDKLYLDKYKYAKNYGISQEEFNKLSS